MSTDFQRNAFKHALAAGKLQIGLWSSLCSNIAADIISDSGFDWLLLDTEHSPNEIPDLVGQLQAVRGGTATPIVRPAWNDTVLIKRVLDIGAQALLVPYVQNVEEAKRAVAATRYPPHGVRGVPPRDRYARQLLHTRRHQLVRAGRPALGHTLQERRPRALILGLGASDLPLRDQQLDHAALDVQRAEQRQRLFCQR